MRTFETADGPMELCEALPEGDVRGAVVVIQEAFGLNDHIQDVTRRFAAAGYHAVAPALFHRSGGGIAEYDDFGTVLPLIKSVTDAAALMDVDAALDHLRAAGHSDDRMGVVGFCFGGRVTFLVTARRSLGAGVTFYGGGIMSTGMLGLPSLIGEAGTLPTPWLGLFGDEDAQISVADIEQLEAAVQSTPVDTEVVRYPGAGHGFHNDVRSALYHEEAANDAWRRTLDFLDAHLA